MRIAPRCCEVTGGKSPKWFAAAEALYQSIPPLERTVKFLHSQNRRAPLVNDQRGSLRFTADA